MQDGRHSCRNLPLSFLLFLFFTYIYPSQRCRSFSASFRVIQSAMGRVIRAQRRGAVKGVKGRTNTTCRNGPAQLRKLDYAEREGYLRGVVTDLRHDPGRGAPVMIVRFKAVYHNRKDDEVIVAPGECGVCMHAYC